MDYSEISDELKEKAKACTTPEELLELTKKEGFVLSDEDLEGVAGGWDTCPNKEKNIQDMLNNCRTLREDCRNFTYGDGRDDIDESFVSDAFMTGELRGDGLD